MANHRLKSLWQGPLAQNTGQKNDGSSAFRLLGCRTVCGFVSSEVNKQMISNYPGVQIFLTHEQDAGVASPRMRARAMDVYF